MHRDAPPSSRGIQQSLARMLGRTLKPAHLRMIVETELVKGDRLWHRGSRRAMRLRRWWFGSGNQTTSLSIFTRRKVKGLRPSLGDTISSGRVDPLAHFT